MIRTAAPVLLALIVAGSTAACGLGGHPADGRAGERIPVHVENRNTHDATIYVYPNAQRIRIGQVRSLDTAVLQSPPAVTGQLRFEIRLLAVGAFESHSISVAPGDTVFLTVPADLHRRR